jgi:glutathione reductase (NADPH)
MAFDYDLFVIGGGSGGVRAARLAAETGARVGLAEADRMGGTCVIRGCVPKKLMVFAAGFAEAKEDADGFGWHLPELTFDWGQFRSRLHAELDRLEGLYRANLASAGVVVHDTRATLAGPHEVTLGSGGTVSAAHILIAVGGRPFKPDLPGIGHALTSDDMFHLPALPKRALVVGGGYIACEFASILNGLGAEVLQYYRGAQILRGFDDELRGHLAEAMRDRGIGLHVGTELERIEPAGDGYRVICTDGSRNEVDLVLYATGRRPNTAGLGLEKAGIATGRNGEIPVDRYSQTGVPSVFAVGDVTDRVNLTPVAIREAAAFVETVFHGRPTAVDHELVAKAVFCRPEIGTIGLTEEAARAREPVEIYTAAFRPMQNILANRPERVLMKMIVAQASRKVLGVHIIGPGAAEIVQMAAVAVTMGATKEDFDRTVAVHPTMAEELVTMKQPARTA